MSLPESVSLSVADIGSLPYVVTSRHIFVTTIGAKKSRELFVQRLDAFTPDLVSLLNDLRKGELTEISFRDQLIGDFIILRNRRGTLKGIFLPSRKQAIDELRTRLAKWKSSR
jgi:hypothetical protein